MQLRDVEQGDVALYVRLRCDAAMTADLGGPRRPEDMPEKVARDVREAASGVAWNLMIMPDASSPHLVAGAINVYVGQARRSEIGWMVLPEYQGRGLAKAAVRLVLERERVERRWGTLHAFTSSANVASNALCRSVPFVLLGEESCTFDGREYAVNHWTAYPST